MNGVACTGANTIKHEWLQHDGDLKLLFWCKHVESTSVCLCVCVCDWSYSSFRLSNVTNQWNGCLNSCHSCMSATCFDYVSLTHKPTCIAFTHLETFDRVLVGSFWSNLITWPCCNLFKSNCIVNECEGRSTFCV